MSRSNPTTKNPAVKFFSWAGSRGELVHWDKDESKEIVEKLPFTFMVLDELSTITGYSDEDSSGYWSNEVRNIKKDELIVKTGKGTKQTGKYDDLTDVRSKGAKYAKSVYIAYKDGNTLAIGNFKVFGSSLSAWIDLSKKADVYKTAVVITGKSDVQTKGKTEYYYPLFETTKVTDDTNKEAVELDRELQTYLSNYFSVKEADEENVAYPSLSGQVPLEAYDGMDLEAVDMGEIPF